MPVRANLPERECRRARDDATALVTVSPHDRQGREGNRSGNAGTGHGGREMGICPYLCCCPAVSLEGHVEHGIFLFRLTPLPVAGKGGLLAPPFSLPGSYGHPMRTITTIIGPEFQTTLLGGRPQTNLPGPESRQARDGAPTSGKFTRSWEPRSR